MVRKEYFLAYLTCVFVISISSSENCLFVLFGHLKKSVFFKLISGKFLYIFICITNTVFQSIICLLMLFMVAFITCGVFYHMWALGCLVQLNLLIFSIIASFLSYMLSPSQITLCFLLALFFWYLFLCFHLHIFNSSHIYFGEWSERKFHLSLLFLQCVQLPYF